jgi:hypothetical protein
MATCKRRRRWAPVELLKGLTYFDNFFDNYTVIVNSKGYEDAAWMPVHISSAKPTTVDLMLVPKDAHLNFSGATWSALSSIRPRFAQILSAGINNAPHRYGKLMEQNQGLVFQLTPLGAFRELWPKRLL